MANISDYLNWRGDLSFEKDPFNEVDNVVLTWLIYTDFDGAAPGKGEPAMTLKEVSDKYYTLHTVEEVKARNTFIATAPLIMKDAAETERFGKIKVSNYFSILDSDIDCQMAAITFEIGDGLTFVAYRGTDDTITGWKEDFDLSFQKATTGQKYALEYLNEVAEKYIEGTLLVGGHSKGGNFAVYAAAFANGDVKDRIETVYSNDGPGFVDEVANSEEFKAMLPKVYKIIPEQSIIGILMTGSSAKKVVKSTQKGAYQHDSTSWQVLGTSLVEVEGRGKDSLFFDQTIRKWLDGISPEEREEFVNSAFDLFEAGGATTLTEFNDNLVSHVIAGVKQFGSMDSEKRSKFINIVGKLVMSGASTIVNPEDKKTIEESDTNPEA